MHVKTSPEYAADLELLNTLLHRVVTAPETVECRDNAIKVKMNMTRYLGIINSRHGLRHNSPNAVKNEIVKARKNKSR